MKPPVRDLVVAVVIVAVLVVLGMTVGEWLKSMTAAEVLRVGVRATQSTKETT